MLKKQVKILFGAGISYISYITNIYQKENRESFGTFTVQNIWLFLCAKAITRNVKLLLQFAVRYDSFDSLSLSLPSQHFSVSIFSFHCSLCLLFMLID